jgi:dihydroorotase-like cyclic amidohydrolase
MELDLVIRNANLVTSTDEVFADIGIAKGKIALVGRKLDGGASILDAEGNYVFPGGVDGHCHIEQLSSTGLICADDFYSGTVSAAFGGTTTIVPFAAQHRGDSVRRVVTDYHGRAKPKAVIDYSFHLILSDPTEAVMKEELPELIRNGYTSFKIYMTYERLRIDDYQMLDVLALARREGALTMVHAENHDMIRWLTDRLLSRGADAPKFHAVAHPREAEAEAASRAIALAELADAPILIVHVSSEEALGAIQRAKRRGLKVFAETCPQYLFLTADDLVPSLGSIRWRGRCAAAALRPGIALPRRRSGAGSPTGASRSSPPITRPTASTSPESSPRGRKHRSTGSRTAFPDSRCACRSSSPRGCAGEGSISTASSISPRRARRSSTGSFPGKGASPSEPTRTS